MCAQVKEVRAHLRENVDKKLYKDRAKQHQHEPEQRGIDTW